MTQFVRPVGNGTPTGVAGVYDYFSLKQAVQDWFARSDLGSWIDYFIQKAEAKIYRDIFAMNQGQGVSDIETAMNVTTQSDGTAPLPSGYLGLKIGLVSLDNNTFELQRRNPEFIYTRHPFRGPAGTPTYIARQGMNFIFGPFPDQAYPITGIYWQRMGQLTSVNNVTWMTNSIPTVLLAACNAAVARFLKDEEAMQIWDAEYLSEMNDFLLAERAEENSGSAFAMVAG
ncbi:phage adaptor protein [Paraburkholderia unamae]|uniref:Bacteriophage Mu GpT domain-containing protein n=1 Tax=Paraburkholderia unamae TaxID=219649 RepID=A0ABX5KHQ3_9BURK|nr:hypothetical protein [Paraburkholderia unamae]PVX77168.1 hypothetical protein C7402_115227 [Paraburkholderia unamae]